MAQRYTNHDHYCNNCGKRIEDGEDYYRCGWGRDFCLNCSDTMCEDCHGCD